MAGLSWTRLPFVGLALVVTIGVPAHAGDWFRRHRSDGHSHDLERDVVRVPGREIVVETERPRIVVSESRERSYRTRGAVAAPPMVATLFTPVALPLSPLVTTTERSFEMRSGDSGALRSVHDLEHQVLEVERARAAHNAERTAIDRAFQRVTRSVRGDDEATDRTPRDKAAKAERTAKLRQIEEEMKKLADRLDKVEKLVITHDEILKKKVQLKD